jgi:hypothetical protein
MSQRIHILLLLFFPFCFDTSVLAQVPQFPEPFISEVELFAGPSLSFLRGNRSVDDNRENNRSAKLVRNFPEGTYTLQVIQGKEKRSTRINIQH